MFNCFVKEQGALFAIKIPFLYGLRLLRSIKTMNKKKTSQPGKTAFTAPPYKTKQDKSFWQGFETKTGFQLFFIVLLPLLVYIKILGFEMVNFDDKDIIIDHYAIVGDIRNIPEAFRRDAFLSDKGDSFYRPIQTVSFMLDALISGESPWMYHLTSLLIHLLSCLALYYFLVSLAIRNSIAFLFSVLFSVHPLFASDISWIPARGDILIGLFALLLFMSFKKHLGTGKKSYFLLHAVVFLLIVFTKETTIVFPFLLLFYYLYILKEKFSLQKLLPYFMVWLPVLVLYLIMRGRVMHGEYNMQVFGPIPLIKNLPVFFITVGKFFIPANLTTLPLLDTGVMIAGIIFSALLLYWLVRCIKEKKWLYVMGVLWFLLLSVPPMLFRIPYTESKYWYLEHRTYLPMMGIIIMLAFLLNDQSNKINLKRLYGLMIPVLLVFILIAAKHSNDYRDPISFFSSAAKYNNAGAYTLRGIEYADRKDSVNAFADLNKAVEISPSFPDAYFNRGKFYEEVLMDHKAAENDLTKTIELNAKYTAAYIKRSVARKWLQNFDGAFSDLDTARKLEPLNAEIYYRQGNLRFAQKKYENALPYFSKAIGLNLAYAEAFNNRGSCYYYLNNFTSALKDYKKAIELNPDYANAYTNLGSLFLEMNKPDEAIPCFDNIIRLSPKNINAYYLKGKALQAKNDVNAACITWKEALQFGNSHLKDTIAKYCK